MNSGLSLGIGIALGVVFGVALDNIGVGVALGVVFGMLGEGWFRRGRAHPPHDESGTPPASS